MSLLRMLSRPRRTAKEYAHVLLGALLGRNVDPVSLDHIALKIARGASIGAILDEITQSEEYLNNFKQPERNMHFGQPRIWNEREYATYTGANKISSIVVVKLDHIGDFILALDSFAAVRAAFPLASITLLCGPWNAGLARSLGVFDRIETADVFGGTGESSLPSFVKESLGYLIDTPFDLAVDFRVYPETRWVLDHLNASHKCGYASGASQSRLTVELPQPINVHSDSLALNQRMLMLSLANAVGAFYGTDAEFSGPALRAKLTGEAKIDPSIHQGKKLVVIHPFSRRAIKNWPIEKFLHLAGWLTSAMGATVVMLGTKAESNSVADLADRCAELGVRSLVGQTSLVEAITLISDADLFIGNDSGLTHVAARLDIPSIAIFSGVAPIEAWAPIGRNLKIVHSPVECAPCYLPNLDHCRAQHRCIATIDFEYVRSQVREQLDVLSRSSWASCDT